MYKEMLVAFLVQTVNNISHSFSQIGINKMNLNSNPEPNINQFYKYMDIQGIQLS